MKRALLLLGVLLLLALPSRAAITFRAAGTFVCNSANTTTIVLVAPAGVAATDVVEAVIFVSDGTGTSITPPTGWTLVNRTDNGTVGGMAVYWALGNVASYTFSLGGNNGNMGFAIAYIGVDNTTPMDAAGVGQANASSATITAPSITTVTANAMLVGFFGINSVSTFTAVFGTIEKSGSCAGDLNAALAGADAIQATAGASGTKTETASVAATNIGILSALRPVAGAAAPAGFNKRQKLQKLGIT